MAQQLIARQVLPKINNIKDMGVSTPIINQVLMCKNSADAAKLAILVVILSGFLS